MGVFTYDVCSNLGVFKSWREAGAMLAVASAKKFDQKHKFD